LDPRGLFKYMSALEDRIAASSKVVITRNAMTAMVRNGSEDRCFQDC
jgi:hypothetical protein